MAGSVNINLSGKLEFNLSFSVTIAPGSNSDDLKSKFKPSGCLKNLASIEMSDRNRIEEIDCASESVTVNDVDVELEDDNIENSDVFASLTDILSSLARPCTNSDRFLSSTRANSPTSSVLSDLLNWSSASSLSSSPLPTYFDETWRNPLADFALDIGPAVAEDDKVVDLNISDDNDDDVVFLGEFKGN